MKKAIENSTANGEASTRIDTVDLVTARLTQASGVVAMLCDSGSIAQLPSAMSALWAVQELLEQCQAGVHQLTASGTR